MLETESLRLHTSTVRLGEKLQGELVLPQGAPGLKQARQVTIRARGLLDYLDVDADDPKWRSLELPGGPEFIREWPARGEPHLPFELHLPRDLPPSYPGSQVKITWEAVASLNAEDGKELMRWSQPFQLEAGRTTRAPEELSPSAPEGSRLTAASTWGCLLFPAVLCFLGPISVLFGDVLASKSSHSSAEQAIGIVLCLGLIAGGGVMTRWIFTKARTISKFQVASLVPLAQRFPLGGTARLRVFLHPSKNLTVSGAELEFTAYEGSIKLGSTGPVAVKVPGQLSQGLNQFDVELPIPREFPPTFQRHLRCSCILNIQLEGLDAMRLNAELMLAPEVLEASSD